jgi:hypothetical protein
LSKKRKLPSSSPSRNPKQVEKGTRKKLLTGISKRVWPSVIRVRERATFVFQGQKITSSGFIRKFFDLIVVFLVFMTIAKQNSLLENQAFWLDEIWRVDLILAPNLFDAFVLHPSSFTAITSPVFALFTRLFTIFFGVSPNSIRLLLSVAAILLSVLIYSFFRKQSPILAIALFYFFITNTEINYWTLEFKPFVFDALIIVVVFLGWFSLLSAQIKDKKKVQKLFYLILIGMLSSVVTVFLLPGIFISLFILARKNQLQIRQSDLLRMGIIVACEAILMYIVFWRHAQADPGMQSFWGNGFFKPGKESFRDFIVRALSEPPLSFIHLSNVDILVQLAAWCLVLFLLISKFEQGINRRIKIYMLFVLSFYITLIVSNYLRMWPLGNLRVNLFLKILAVVFICAGALLLVNRPQFRFFYRTITLALIGILFYASYQNALVNIPRPLASHPQYVMNNFKDNGIYISEINQVCKKSKSVIVVSPAMGFQMNYYAKYDGQYSPFLRTLESDCIVRVPMSQIGEIGTQDKAVIQSVLENGGKVFWLFSSVSKQDIMEIKTQAGLIGTPGLLFTYAGGDGYFQLNK